MSSPVTGTKPGPTLLPGPIASTISFATRSTTLAIRLGSFFGAYGLDAARFTTLSSLELARGLVEVVLTRAGKDTLHHSSGSLAASDAENILERSLESLHYAVMQVAFWTSASFRLTGTTLSLASDASQLLLSSFDKIFGSTGSSRAVASIITLMRREFRNPVTGTKGERVGVIDLILALSALAYLQQACRKLPQEETRRRLYEEVIWDVVVLDGDRIDVDDEAALQLRHPPAVTRESFHGAALDDQDILSQLRTHISQSLPPDAKFTISNSITTIQTIEVQVDGRNLSALPTLPGAEVIEKSSPALRPYHLPSSEKEGEAPYRVIYRIERDKFKTLTLHGRDEAETGSILGEVDDEASPPMQYDAATGIFLPSSVVPLPSKSVVEESKLSSSTTSAEANRPDAKPLQSPKERCASGPTANQKRSRLLASELSDRPTNSSKKLASKKTLDGAGRPVEKKVGLKRVLKESGHSLSNIWSKEGGESHARSKPQWQAASSRTDSRSQNPSLTRPTLASQERSIVARRSLKTPEPSAPRDSLASVANQKRDSSSSPTCRRSDLSIAQGPGRHSRRGSLLSIKVPLTPTTALGDMGSCAQSIYSMATNDSQTSLVLSSYYKKSTFSAADALNTLRQEGFVDGTFPEGHLLPNMTRYMRFSSACYGSHFLKLLGISKDMPKLKSWDGTHRDVRHFAHHTESGSGNILLASFVDPQGGTDSTGATNTGVPLVHYISLDHEAKAVVLACRGTLGFEDVMVDMTCEYDDLVWMHRAYKVHKGIHASARRLLYDGDGRVLITLKEALVEFPGYGLVLCGHSLGGGVTALLGVMLAEVNPRGPGFVTAREAAFGRMLADGTTTADHASASDIMIPAGRRIHVYAYGAPGVMSAKLRKLTRGLITTVVHGNDLVPHLSLGVLHDFQALALAFKKKEQNAATTKEDLSRRMWTALQSSLSEAWNRAGDDGSRATVSDNDDDRWMLPALAALRESMTSERLVPPGEVFVIESSPVLRREAFLLRGEGQAEGLGRRATRVVLKYVRDAETRFSELRFGTSMLSDHSPANYEDALNKMRLGVME